MQLLSRWSVALCSATVIVWCVGIQPAPAAQLFGGGASGGTLYEVTTPGGGLNFVGGLPFSAQLAMAYVPAEDRIYSFDNVTNNLWRLNPADGTGVVVATLPYDFVHGLAYDVNNNVLYGHDINTGTLFTINRANGATTAIGNSGVGFLGGLEYDPINDILYGIGFSPVLYSFNVNTGAATNLGAVSGFPTSLVVTLGIDPDTGLMYAVDDSRGLFVFDRNVRNASLVVQLPQRFSGLSHTYPEPASATLLVLGGACLLRRQRVARRRG